MASVFCWVGEEKKKREREEKHAAHLYAANAHALRIFVRDQDGLDVNGLICGSQAIITFWLY